MAFPKHTVSVILYALINLARVVIFADGKWRKLASCVEQIMTPNNLRSMKEAFCI